MRRRALLWAGWALAAAAAGLASGCDTAPIYTEAKRDLALGEVPDRSRWRVVDSAGLEGPERAIDGSVRTAAVASAGAAGGAGARLTIDLGKAGLFNMIAVDHGPNEFGFARRAAVLVSLDGREFKKVYEAIGTRRVSSYLLVSPEVARYVRLEVLVPGPKPWSVAEIHLQ